MESATATATLPVAHAASALGGAGGSASTASERALWSTVLAILHQDISRYGHRAAINQLDPEAREHLIRVASYCGLPSNTLDQLLARAETNYQSRARASRRTRLQEERKCND